MNLLDTLTKAGVLPADSLAELRHWGCVAPWYMSPEQADVSPDQLFNDIERSLQQTDQLHQQPEWVDLTERFCRSTNTATLWVQFNSAQLPELMENVPYCLTEDGRYCLRWTEGLEEMLVLATEAGLELRSGEKVVFDGPPEVYGVDGLPALLAVSVVS